MQKQQTHQKQAPPHELFDKMMEQYLGGVLRTDGGTLELEARFGTRNLKHVASITKIDFDNVIKTMLSSGFVMEKTDDYTLKINSEITDPQTGKYKMADIRTEIRGIHNIQLYCKTNSLDKVHPVFVQKTGVDVGDGEIIHPLNFDDFNFRLSLQKEKQFAESSSTVKTVVVPWRSSRKTFRYINRSTFRNPAMPFAVDMSIVKESRRDYGPGGSSNMIPTHTFAESQVTESQPKYEIEIEVLNDAVGQGTAFNSARKLADAMRSCIKTVMSGLQGTNYPIGLTERSEVAADYMHLLHPEHKKEKEKEKGSNGDAVKLFPKQFIGPSSYTLQLQNVVPVNENCTIPNVRNNYTVTDKADGARKLLYVSPTGRIYLIDTNMRVQFTGAQSGNDKLFNTLLDGEHILHDKAGRFINLFAAFDAYYIAGKDVRALHFVPPSAEVSASKYRLPLLVELIAALNARSIVRGAAACPVRIECKKFKYTGQDQSIFQCCATLMSQIDSNAYEYTTDGIIFTPADAPVGGDVGGEAAGPKTKITWPLSFKWKPAEANTIDFLATLVKDTNGQPKVTSIFTDGINVTKMDQVVQYKTLTLRVGFDEKKHGYLNPCEDVIQGKLPSRRGANERGANERGANERGANEDSYKPVPFYPTNPYDPTAHVCNVILRADAAGNRGTMLTAENEVIEDGTIIECAYNSGAADPLFRWVPLRVRTDKTAEYRSGQKNYGNAYHVANSNWHTIHSPITKKMLTTGLNIPDELADDDVYYNRVSASGTTNTRGLRDFHNLVVKRALIGGASRRGNTLIDFAVGKGGDLPKWIHANLSFVFGIDISKDNIQNQLDGACARYLDYCKRFSIMPAALFVQGNSALNIKSGTGISGEKYKQIVKAVFGDGPKDKALLGEGVYREYGKAENGFNVSSCQFAIHYMFETRANVCNFLRNVCECTEVGGYFIGTTYDGATMFDALKSYEVGDGIAVMHKGKRVWQVTKAYTATEFPDDETSVGYAIDVYQESINKTFREYLVNFNYLKRLLANFGFEVVQRDDAAKDLGLPDGTGMFEQLYEQMMARLKQTPALASDLGDAPDMRDYERRISFYNRYFVFKKVRSIDNAELVVKSLLGTSTVFEKQMAALEQEQAELDEAEAIVGAPVVPLTNPKPKPKAKPAATASVVTAPVAKPVTAPVAKPVAEGPEPEKKKPGRKPKIQLVVKEP